MRKFLALICVSLFSLFAAVQSVQAAPIARLIIDSEQGSYIGGGQSYDIFYDSAVNLHPTVFFRNGSVHGVSFSSYSGSVLSERASLMFVSPRNDLPLTTGFYADAQRAAFADPDHPGLDVSFQHRASNTLTGSFEILKLMLVPGKQEIQSFFATFVQVSDGGSSRISGSFHYEADGLSVPAPASIALLVAGLFGIALFRRRRVLR